MHYTCNSKFTLAHTHNCFTLAINYRMKNYHGYKLETSEGRWKKWQVRRRQLGVILQLQKNWWRLFWLDAKRVEVGRRQELAACCLDVDGSLSSLKDEKVKSCLNGKANRAIDTVVARSTLDGKHTKGAWKREPVRGSAQEKWNLISNQTWNVNKSTRDAADICGAFIVCVKARHTTVRRHPSYNQSN